MSEGCRQGLSETMDQASVFTASSQIGFPPSTIADLDRASATQGLEIRLFDGSPSDRTSGAKELLHEKDLGPDRLARVEMRAHGRWRGVGSVC
jgi:hypothetical protein